MADSSLDDFFAKKDKSKKGKKKFTTPDELAKQLEEGKNIIEKPKKEKEKTSSGNQAQNAGVKTSDQDENEWKDVDEEKDYTGLKVSALTVKDKEEELREQKAFEIEESKKEDQGGPWGGKGEKGPGSDDQHGDEELVEDRIEIKESAPPAGPTKYVPPGQRAGNRDSATSSGPRPSWRKMNAPKIDNAEDFPSLGDVAPEPLSKDFKPVKHGSREIGGPTGGGQRVTLGNKFNALSSNREPTN